MLRGHRHTDKNTLDSEATGTDGRRTKNCPYFVLFSRLRTTANASMFC